MSLRSETVTSPMFKDKVEVNWRSGNRHSQTRITVQSFEMGFEGEDAGSTLVSLDAAEAQRLVDILMEAIADHKDSDSE